MTTHRLRGALFGMFALFAAACAPFAPRTTAPLIASDSLVEAKRSAAMQAYARLQRALDARDSMAIAVNLHPEIMLISPASDTLFGASAWRFLVFLVGDSTKTLKLGPGKFEPCLQGDVYQYNGDFRPRGGPVQVTGRFGILWATDERPVVARQMVLSFTRSGLRKRLPCQPEFHVASAQRRVTGFLTTGVDLLSGASGQDVVSAMRAAGMRYQPPPGRISGPGEKPYPRNYPGWASITAGLRYRSERTRSRELQLDIGLPQTVRGFDDVASRYVEATALQGSVSLLFQTQRRPYRFGIGPTARLARWTVHEDQRTLQSIQSILIIQHPGTADTVYTENTFWVKAAGTPVYRSQSWSPSVGLAFEMARLIPITRQMGGELLLRGGLGTSSKVPGTPGFPGTTAANRFLTIGASIGKGWR